MDWSEFLAGAFPAPRDDEPTTLRQDIADELADHLQSALQRQLLTTPDAGQARERVLDRFGNPQAIARQLWFDALKEKIMSQRMMRAWTALMTVICVAALVAIWFVVEQGRAATLALIADNRAELESHRAENQALLARVEKLAAASMPAIDWKPPLKVRVVSGKGEGPPVEGLVVTLEQQLRQDRGPEKLAEQKTGPDGVADFGPLLPGAYLLSVRTAWKEFSTVTVDHHPGGVRVDEVICPESPPYVETDVCAHVNWPDDLRDRQLWLICYFHSKDDDFESRWFAGNQWISPPNSTGRPDYVLLPPGGGLISGGMIGFTVDRTNDSMHHFSQEKYSPFSPIHSAILGFGVGMKSSPAQTNHERGLRVDMREYPHKYFFGLDDIAAVPQFHWPAADYRLTQIVVAMNPTESHAGAIRKLNVIGGLKTENRAAADGPPGMQRGMRGTHGGPMRSDDPRNVNRDENQPRFAKIEFEDTPKFEAVAGKQNDWQITLPEALLVILRERLAQSNE